MSANLRKPKVQDDSKKGMLNDQPQLLRITLTALPGSWVVQPIKGMTSHGTDCENILRGYLYDGDLVFVILKGTYGFKFPKSILEISSRDLTSFFLQLI